MGLGEKAHCLWHLQEAAREELEGEVALVLRGANHATPAKNQSQMQGARHSASAEACYSQTTKT